MILPFFIRWGVEQVYMTLLVKAACGRAADGDVPSPRQDILIHRRFWCYRLRVELSTLRRGHVHE
jgi:hypothetical protein